MGEPQERQIRRPWKAGHNHSERIPLMMNQRREWCRSLLTALLTVTCSAAVMAQPATRLGANSPDFGNFDQGIRGGGITPALNPKYGSPGTARQDLSGVDIRIVENLLKECVAEAERLYTALDADYRRYPELRTQLQDVVTLRARASRLSQDITAGYSLERLQPDLKQLDSDWHYLSHQMSQARQLSTATRDSVDRIDRLDRQLEKLFQMEPQLDRRALMIELARLDSSVRNLVQELELDPEAGNRVYQLVIDSRKLNQQAYRVQQMVVDETPYTNIVSEYGQFSRMWTELSPQLQKLTNRFVERSMRDILMANSNVHDLLWIEQKTSNANLLQIATALNRDVDEFYNRVPLKLLLNFKDVSSILQTSDEFYGTVQNFLDCVNRREDERALLNCYQYVEEYGAAFVRAFEPLRSSAGRVVLREIEDGIVALRNELNIAGTVSTLDTRAMIPMAAALENLADHMDYDVRQWLTRDRQSFSTQALEASSKFVKRTERIHGMLQSQPRAAQLKKETADLVEEWRALYAYLGRCNTDHREHLRVLSGDISEAIYKLRVPLQL
jgi:hypothetical protein